MKPTEVQETPPKYSQGFAKLIEALSNTAARTYLIIAAISTLTTSMSLFFLYNSPLGGAVVLSLGLLGLAFTWTSAPPLLFISSVYFALSPDGLLQNLMPFSMIPGSHFRLPDLILTASILGMMVSFYRYLTCIHSGMPFESKKLYLKETAKPPRRAAVAIEDEELIQIVWVLLIAVIAGQLLWLVATSFEIDFRNVPPIRVAPEKPMFPRNEPTDTERPMLSEPMNRLILSVAIFLAIAFVLRFVFWYWSLINLNTEEGKLTLVDIHWREHRRELDRQEKWRVAAIEKHHHPGPTRYGCGTTFVYVGLLVGLIVVYWLIASVFLS